MKHTDEPVSPAVEEEARLYEVVVWIAPFSNPKLFLLTGLKVLNFSERNGFPHGVAMGYAALVLIAYFLSFHRIGGYYARKGVALAERTQDPGSLGFAYEAMAVHEILSWQV